MKRILLVDDNDDYLEIMELILGRKYIIRSCTETKDVGELIVDVDPDLIIVDYSLGLFSSHKVLQSFRSPKTGSPIPFILFSAIHDIDKRAEELGANGFISKPSSIEYIRNYIEDFFTKN
jgi:response regulator RpfG family c-di-GMP phosphodiesterase